MIINVRGQTDPLSGVLQNITRGLTMRRELARRQELDALDRMEKEHQRKIDLKRMENEEKRLKLQLGNAKFQKESWALEQAQAEKDRLVQEEVTRLTAGGPENLGFAPEQGFGPTVQAVDPTTGQAREGNAPLAHLFQMPGVSDPTGGGMLRDPETVDVAELGRNIFKAGRSEEGRTKTISFPDDPKVPEFFRGKTFSPGDPMYTFAIGAASGVAGRMTERSFGEELARAEAVAEASARGRRAGRGGAMDDPAFVDQFLEVAAPDWQSFNATHLTEDTLSTRTGLTRANAKILAKKHGRVIPPKKLGQATLAANAQLSDIRQIQELSSRPEVREWISKYKGNFNNFLAEGWLEPMESWFGGEVEVPEAVWELRATLGRANSEERKRVYGAAITGTELPLSRSWLASMTQSLSAFDAAINEAEDNIVRAMDAQWGTKTEAEGEFRIVEVK